MHPYQDRSYVANVYLDLTYGARLWRYNPTRLAPEPDAALSWTVSDDKLIYTFRLRDGLKWSDGQPLTSADYKFTFDQAANPNNRYPQLSDLQLIASYEAPDPTTLIVRMKEPLAIGLEVANLITPLPRHVWRDLDWSDPSKNPQIMAPTVSSGPFRLKEWQRDDHAIFEANDYYYRGRPILDRYVVRVVPSSAIAFQMLKGGEVDTALVLPENLAEARAVPGLRVYEWWPAGATWSYLGFNLRRPHLQDVNVRRALSYAVDREVAAGPISDYVSRPTYSTFAPTSWVYNPNVPRYDYDPERARRMLDEAGWKAGPDGVRRNGDTPLSLRILFGPNTIKATERMAVLTQQWLREVGVLSEIQGLEWGAYQAALKTAPYDWDINIGTWPSAIEPHWTNQIWRESSIPELNHVGYVNKTVESLFDQGVREFDPEKRKQIYQEIQRIISEDAPYVFLVYSMHIKVVNDRIGGIEATLLGTNHNIEAWYVK